MFSQKDMSKTHFWMLQLLLLLYGSVIYAQEINESLDSLQNADEVSIDELNRQIENPL